MKAGGGGSCTASTPKKSSISSSMLSSVMLMLKHTLGVVGVREKVVVRLVKSSPAGNVDMTCT